MKCINKDKMVNNFFSNNFSNRIEMSSNNRFFIRRLDRRPRERLNVSYSTRNINRLRRQGRNYLVYRGQRGRQPQIVRRINFVTQQVIEERRRVQRLLTGFEPMPVDDQIGPSEAASWFWKNGGKHNTIIIKDSSGNNVFTINRFTDFTQLWIDSQTSKFEKYREDNNYTGRFFYKIQRGVRLLDNQRVNQTFSDDKKYTCCIQPILTHFTTGEKLEQYNKRKEQHTTLKNNKDKTSSETKEMKTAKKFLNRRDRVIQTCNEFMDKSKKQKGLTKNDIEEFAHKSGITFEVRLPFNNVNELFICNTRASYKFVFFNTRINHLEALNNDNCLRLCHQEGRKSCIKVNNIETQNEMLDILHNKEIDIYYKGGDCSVTTIFTVDNQKFVYRQCDKDIEKEFYTSNNLRDYQLYINPNNEYLQNFIDNMSGVAGCIDFHNIETYRERHHNGEKYNLMLGQIDRAKSYFNYDRVGDYNEGCAGKLLHYGALPNPNTKEYTTHLSHYKELKDHYVIFFVIKDIKITNPKLKFYNDKLNFFLDDRIIEGRFLDFLDKYDTEYIVTNFVMFSRIHLEFSKDTKKKDDKNVPIYSKMIGKMFGIVEEQSYYKKGGKSDCRMFNYELEQQQSSTYCEYNDYTEDIRVATPRSIYTSYAHIASSIVQSQYLCTFEQLMKMNEDKVVRVIGDGIYYIPHKFKILNDFGFYQKTAEKHFKLRSYGGTCLSSSEIFDWSKFYLDSKFVENNKRIRQPLKTDHYIVREDQYKMPRDKVYPKNIPKLYNSIEIWKGQGGTGKTYTFYKEKLLQENLDPHEYRFLCPTHQLCNDVRDSHFDTITRGKYQNVMTRHAFTREHITDEGERNKNWNELKHNRQGVRVIVIDEFSNSSPDILKEVLFRCKVGKGHIKGLDEFRFILIGDVDITTYDRREYDNYDKFNYIPTQYLFNYQIGNNHSFLLDYDITYQDFTNDHRAKDCKILQQVKTMCRFNIKCKETEKGPMCFLDKRKFHNFSIFTLLRQFSIPSVKYSNLNDEYNVERGDFIVSSYNGLKSANKFKRNRFVKIINQPFIKYKIGDSSQYITLPRGEEPPKNCRECYSISCNSIQGTTIHHPKLIFLDCMTAYSQFTLQHLFVSLSRGNNIRQYRLIVKD